MDMILVLNNTRPMATIRPIRSEELLVFNSSSFNRTEVSANNNESEEIPRTSFFTVGIALTVGLLDMLGKDDSVGEVLGLNDGETDGWVVGEVDVDGDCEGLIEGEELGSTDMVGNWEMVGNADGDVDGLIEMEGNMVGSVDIVGDADGRLVGLDDMEGEEVG